VNTDNHTTDDAVKDTISRTNLALDRTVLANERTYAAWIRTGLAALASGLATVKFLAEILPVWSIRVIATVLIGFSAATFLLAAWRYQHLHIKVSHLELDVIPLFMIRIMSFVLASSSIIALIYSWYSTK
jgi:putative membrane protein